MHSGFWRGNIFASSHLEEVNEDGLGKWILRKLTDTWSVLE
jgi:hypothetical protein